MENKISIWVIIFLSIFIIFSLVVYPLTYPYIQNLQKVPTRDGKIVQISSNILSELNQNYKSETEYLFCIIGHEENNHIIIEELIEPEILERKESMVTYEQDPPCQIDGSIGSIHSHPQQHKFKYNLCLPSTNDLYTWGEMKDPEPIIQMIQCGESKFYIFESPEKHKGIEIKSLNWIET